MTAICKTLLEETAETPEINNWYTVTDYHFVDDHTDERFDYAYLPHHPALYNYEIFVALKDGLWRARFNHGETLPKVTFTDHDNPRDAILEAEEQVAEYYSRDFNRGDLEQNIESNLQAIEQFIRGINHAHREIKENPFTTFQLDMETYGRCIPLWLKELHSGAREMYLSTRFVYEGLTNKDKLVECLRADIEAPAGESR